MSVYLAYLAVIIIWSTTPLTVQWSTESDPFFAVAIRMMLGIIGCWLFIAIKKINIPFSKKVIPIYLVTGISLFLAMSLVYWSAQYIPSGWISVLFGLSPIITAIFATLFLSENNLSLFKIIGMMLGFTGLALVFSSGLQFNATAIWGLITCLMAVIITGISAVLIKQLNIDAQLSGIQTNIGGLTIAVPFFIVSWLWFSDTTIPDIPLRSGISIVYLGFIGTTVGFSLYYFLLKNLEATRVSLIALITPITALILGSWLNNEPIIDKVWLGAGFICAGLICFELKKEEKSKKVKPNVIH